MLFRSLMDARRSAPLGAGLAMLVLVACSDDGPLLPQAPPATAGVSVAYGRWSPGPDDTCTKEIHDGYSVAGPDGKVYPTWHPPVDPMTGCSFGHEHGRDPRESNLFDEVGWIPFGYANEQLDLYDPLTPRHEDHVGHKVDWENDFTLKFNGAGNAIFDIRCDALVKLHQGTHSKDAFTNNLHELAYHISCSDGTRMHLQFMAAIGKAGEFVSSCNRDRHVQVGTATPPNSPDGSGKRAIPDAGCVMAHLMVPEGGRSNFNSGLRESWEVSQRIRTVDGKTLASINPYFQVMRPSRFYDADASGLVGRPIELCYGIDDVLAARGEDCDESTGRGHFEGVTYDDPRSHFDGVRRFVDINSNRIQNADGPDVWYTDPFGHNARTESFLGSIRQVIGKIDNSAYGGSGPVIGKSRDYGGPGVHAPN